MEIEPVLRRNRQAITFVTFGRPSFGPTYTKYLLRCGNGWDSVPKSEGLISHLRSFASGLRRTSPDISSGRTPKYRVNIPADPTPLQRTAVLQPCPVLLKYILPARHKESRKDIPTSSALLLGFLGLSFIYD